MGTKKEATARSVKPRSAADLIATCEVSAFTPMPSAAACEQLLELCASNDSKGASGPGRFSREAAVKWLRDDYGWVGRGPTALDSVCRRLGRSSYAKP